MFMKSTYFRGAAASVLAQVFLLQSAFVESAHAQGFTVLDFPGSVNSRAYGIDGSTIVGWQQPVMSPGVFPAGYRYDGTFSELQFPGGRYTTARDVSGGRIVGSYENGATFRNESFIYENGNWTTLNRSDYAYTFAESVDGNRVAGWLASGPGSAVGFIYNVDNGAWTTHSFPGSTSTAFHGIDGANIVGSYNDASYNTHGFRYDGTNWTTLDFPGATDTSPRAISGNNIVGSYTDPAGVKRGFRYDGRFWHTLRTSPDTSSSNNGIDGGTIVGEYTVGGVTHGFSTPVIDEVPREYKFALRGVVTEVIDPGNRFNGAFHVGDAVEGQYNYFDGRYQEGVTADGSTSIFTYFFERGGISSSNNDIDPAPVSLELEIGDHAYTSGRNGRFGAFDYQLRITNDADGSTPPNQVGDRYHLQSQLQMPDHFQDVDNASISTVFALQDESGTALSSIDFPTSAPDVSKFASRIGRINLTNRDSFELLAQVVFRIDAIAAVPEPSCAALLCAAVVGLGSVRSRRFGLH